MVIVSTACDVLVTVTNGESAAGDDIRTGTSGVTLGDGRWQ